MRVLVAGASGVLGRALIPRLTAAGHDVVGLARTEPGTHTIEGLGAEAMTADALDAERMRTVVGEARADVIVNQLTAIPARIPARGVDRAFAATNRLRVEGTANLIAAAAAAGIGRHVAQSTAFAYAPGGHERKTEDAPLNLRAPGGFASNVAAIAALEEATLAAGGVVLRYGHFYGPGTTYARGGQITEQIRRRALPIVGRGRGLFSFIHVDDAADATVAALELSAPTVLNIVDDDPAPSAEWIATIARTIGAKSPRHVPAPVARVVAGPWAVEWMDRLRGASNERATATLDWAPRIPSWRDGFASELEATDE